MPERSFGRTVRYRRTKLGLSQAKLGELVGRSATTVRSWERDKSQPTDHGILTALAAILGVDERTLFEKAGQTPPEVESSPTIEEALATLEPELAEATKFNTTDENQPVSVEPELASEPEPESVAEPEPVPVGELVPVKSEPSLEVAAYATPPAPYVMTQTMPRAPEPSYIEDGAQRQLYRVRYLATVVLLVALGIAFVWALGEGFGALGDWWDEFFGSLRL